MVYRRSPNGMKWQGWFRRNDYDKVLEPGDNSNLSLNDRLNKDLFKPKWPKGTIKEKE